MADLYVAVAPLTWGDGDIQPGEPVPAGEVGRDYDGLLRHGLIAKVGSHDASSDDAEYVAELETEIESLTAERDALATRVAELEAARPPEVDSPNAEAKTDEAAAAPDPGALPEGVTETSPGWFLLADGTTKIHGRAALDAHLAGQQE